MADKTDNAKLFRFYKSNIQSRRYRTLIEGGGGVYLFIHVLPDIFLFKLIDLNFLKETRRAEHEYMNMPSHPSTIQRRPGRVDPNCNFYAVFHVFSRSKNGSLLVQLAHY